MKIDMAYNAIVLVALVALMAGIVWGIHREDKLAFQVGYQANRAGVCVTDNPFPDSAWRTHSRQQHYWWKGWVEAEVDKR